MIDTAPAGAPPAFEDALLGLVSTLERLDAVLLRALEAPASAAPLPPDDPVLEACLGLVAFRDRAGRALLPLHDDPPDAPPAPAPLDRLLR